MPNIREVAEAQMAAARTDEHGRSADLVAHDAELRQTVIAMVEGTRLPPHNSPPAATLQVLSGRIRVELQEGRDPQGEFGEGELWVLTHEPHSILALADSVFLLTTVTSVDRESFGS